MIWWNNHKTYSGIFSERKKKVDKAKRSKHLLLSFLTNGSELWNLGWSDYKSDYTVKQIKLFLLQKMYISRVSWDRSKFMKNRKTTILSLKRSIRFSIYVSDAIIQLS